ncbi:MAG: selenium metabolism-associated LysR family transcriptional regulator [Thermodesulfovibrionales bacterium]|nr:selenium metabolism-associated LysR family transcriptional regulator [Thermodesulfovibrionales bacterium]
MEDHKLKVFRIVAETKSFSKASAIIRLTQPAVSLLIRALEETYETKLFDRANNTVTLTPAGEMLYKYAKEILNLYATAENNIGEITGFMKGGISVGASSTIGNYLLPSVIADFRKTHPKIKVHLLVGNTKRVVDLLDAGNIDIGLVEGDVARQKMIVDRIVTDELALIVPPLHPLAKKRSVSIFETTKEPFIFREEGSGTRKVIEKYFGKYNITPQNMMISMVLGSTEAIKESVENGMGIAIVSRWEVRKESKYGTLKPLSFKEEKMLRDFSLIFQKKAISSHAVDEFLPYLKAYSFDKLLSLSE